MADNHNYHHRLALSHLYCCFWKFFYCGRLNWHLCLSGNTLNCICNSLKIVFMKEVIAINVMLNYFFESVKSVEGLRRGGEEGVFNSGLRIRRGGGGVFN